MAKSVPEATIESLLKDLEQLLGETLAPFQMALEATSYELPASITLSVKYKPAKEPKAEGDEGDAAAIEVTAKSSLPGSLHRHGVQAAKGQISLF